MRCHRIFTVNPLLAVSVKDEKTAITKVKYYRTGEHDKEFMTTVEQSRQLTSEIRPLEDMEQEEMRNHQSDTTTLSQLQLLNQLLRLHADHKAIDLESFKNTCEEAGLLWTWVAKQIEAQVRVGHLVCPKPWQVQLVTKILPEHRLKQEHSSATLAKRLGEIIRGAKPPISLESLMIELCLEESATALVEETLELLMAQGFVFRTSRGRYRWIGG
jgi:hypothetical protein